MSRARPRNEYLRAVVVLTSGTAAAQGISVAVSPILTRVFDPADLGQYGMFLSFFVMALPVVALRYDLALVSARDEREATSLMMLCGLLVPLTAFGSSTILLVLITVGIGEFGKLPPLLSPICFVGLIAGGLVTCLRYWAVHGKRFKSISAMLVGQSIARAVAQVGLGLMFGGVVALALGEAIGRTLGVSGLARSASATVRTQWRSMEPRDVWQTARTHWRYPAVSVPSSLLEAATIAVATPLIAASFGLVPAGLFLLVQRVLALPVAVVGAAVADVFHSRLSTGVVSSDVSARRLMVGTSAALLALGLPFAAVVILAGERIFGFVFGAEWTPAGAIAAAMVPWMLAQLAVSPVSRAVYVLSAQRLKLAYDAVSLSATVGSLTVAGQLGADAVEAIWALSLAKAVSYGLYFVLLYRIAGHAHSPLVAESQNGSHPPPPT